MKHQITRRIEIDAGHRIPLHESKCKNIHGHRYVIEATVKGELASDGAEAGMVMDFGFIKAEMVAAIDRVYDHALILWRGDEVYKAMQKSGQAYGAGGGIVGQGYELVSMVPYGNIVVLDVIPTAENLARVWFDALAPRIDRVSEGNAELDHIVVRETPNCSARYPIALHEAV